MGAGRVGGAPTGKIRAITWVKGQGLERPSRTAWRAAGADGGRVAGADGGRRTAGTVADEQAGEEGDRRGGRAGRRVAAEPPCPARNGRTREESRGAHAWSNPHSTRTQPALGKDPTRSDSIAPRTHSHPYQLDPRQYPIQKTQNNPTHQWTPDVFLCWPWPVATGIVYAACEFGKFFSD